MSNDTKRVTDMGVQHVVKVELKSPLHIGKQQMSWYTVTMRDEDSATMIDDVLRIDILDASNQTIVWDSENVLRENVVTYRSTGYVIPILEGYEAGSYTYEPYTFPRHVGGYLGYYNDKDGKCIAFLNTDLQITMMADLEA